MNSSHILIYDAKCLYCNRFIELIDDNLAQKNGLKVYSIHGDFAQKVLSENGWDMNSAYYLYKGLWLKRSRAILYLVKDNVRYGNWIYRFCRFMPSKLLDWFYNQFAKNRYRFQKHKTCSVDKKDFIYLD